MVVGSTPSFVTLHRIQVAEKLGGAGRKIGRKEGRNEGILHSELSDVRFGLDHARYPTLMAAIMAFPFLLSSLVMFIFLERGW